MVYMDRKKTQKHNGMITGKNWAHEMESMYWIFFLGYLNEVMSTTDTIAKQNTNSGVWMCGGNSHILMVQLDELGW